MAANDPRQTVHVVSLSLPPQGKSPLTAACGEDGARGDRGGASGEWGAGSCIALCAGCVPYRRFEAVDGTRAALLRFSTLVVSRAAGCVQERTNKSPVLILTFLCKNV